MTPDLSGILRARQDETADDASRRQGDGPAAVFPVVVGQVFGNPTVPTASGVYVSVRPVAVAGVEAEAAPGVLAVDTTRSFLTYVTGSKPPLAGDYLICRFVGNRWVADRMGKASSGGIVIPGCACPSSPATLHVAVSRPDATSLTLQPCTLFWGPTPAGLLPLAVGANSYLSSTSFTDTSTGDQFWYHFNCYVGYYALTRVYVTSQYGSPYRDLIRYRWPIGAGGNSCKPFLMASGQLYLGGDPACVVTVSE
jgi:hypothetical protein